ncbi:MAG: transglutaminase-like domain-containing protein [Rhodospirillales bacterium]|nr:transglutaminase-like domain-containing protein [Rhodospirillales bacterium]
MSDPRRALEAIGALPDAEIDIAGAALQLARIDAPEADWLAAEAHLSSVAREAAALAAVVAAEDGPTQAAALAGLLAGQFGYAGDTETYDALANANLIRVIERRRGLPVALGVLWLHAARAAGWEAHGVDFPGHFLVALAGGPAATVIDPFGGGTMLDARALRALLRRREGAAAELRPGLLAPAGARAVLLRLQNNIRLRRHQGGDVAGALASALDMLRMAPLEPALWWDTAMLHAELGQTGAALRCLGQFADLVPAAAAQAHAVMDELRSRRN